MADRPFAGLGLELPVVVGQQGRPGSCPMQGVGRGRLCRRRRPGPSNGRVHPQALADHRIFTQVLGEQTKLLPILDCRKLVEGRLELERLIEVARKERRAVSGFAMDNGAFAKAIERRSVAALAMTI